MLLILLPLQSVRLSAFFFHMCGQVIIAQRQIRAVWEMIENLALKVSCMFLCLSCSMQSGIVMEEQYTGAHIACFRFLSAAFLRFYSKPQSWLWYTIPWMLYQEPLSCSKKTVTIIYFISLQTLQWIFEQVSRVLFHGLVFCLTLNVPHSCFISCYNTVQ